MNKLMKISDNEAHSATYRSENEHFARRCRHYKSKDCKAEWLPSSAFLVGFAALGTLLDTGTWLAAFLIGVLTAYQVLYGEIDAQYGELLLESAAAWGIWILLAIFREFAGSGAIFGNTIMTRLSDRYLVFLIYTVCSGFWA